MTTFITCPLCGPRSGYEFKYGGEDKGLPPTDPDISPSQWCDYVHMNTCVAGPVKEWWYHKDGCGSWFVIERNTVSDITITPTPGQASKDIK